MAAKCNISDFILKEIGVFFYGFKCEDSSLAILENYAEYLNCPINLEVCNPADCVNEPIIFNCQFNILRTSVTISNTTVTFTLDTDDYVGGTTPFTYEWNFEEDDFIVAGPINTNQLVLTVKPGKVLDNLVTKVGVTVIDANGCTDIKECWLNKGILKCSQNFVPCTNPSGLVVIDDFVQCAGPSALVVEEL